MRSKVLILGLLLCATCLAGSWNEVMDVSQIQDFTPASNSIGATSSWVRDTPGSHWLDEVWAWNSDQQFADFNGGLHWTPAISGGSEGGVVYKFQSLTPVRMSVNINALFYNGFWAGRKATVYFSDENNWSAIRNMQGSLWEGWGADFEVNPKWQMLETLQSWGAYTESGFTESYFDLGGTVYTNDGTFYVRVDMTLAGAPVPQCIVLEGLNVEGTVVAPEPAVWIQSTGYSTEVSEAGDTDSYFISLATAPADQVTIVADVNSLSNQVLIEANGSTPSSSVSLDFTTSNWNAPQEIIVHAIDDSIDEVVGWPPVPHMGEINHTSYSQDSVYMDSQMGGSMTVDSVYVSVTDNDWTCGKDGMEYLPGDVNKNCVVGIDDLSEIISAWLQCNLPGDAACVETW